MRNNFCLFLTGTISPREGINRLKRKNVDVREEDYFRSIAAWMKLNIPIVFCENSNYNSKKISSLFENYSGDGEYLKFQSDSCITEKGKGETEIFNYCYNNSEVLRRYQFIIKCTGRLYVENFSDIIESIPADKFCFVYADLLRNMTWANSMFFMYDTGFYKEYLRKYLDKIDESNFIYFEHTLARSIHAAMADGYEFSLLPYPVKFLGYHGSSDEQIKNDFFRVIKRLIVLRLKSWAFKLAT